MKQTTIIIFLLFSLNSFSQNNKTIKNIFYNLPIERTREEIKKSLNKDKRFISKNKKTEPAFQSKDTIHFIIPDIFNTYIGKCLDNGITYSKADSIEIELTFGYESGEMSMDRRMKYNSNETETTILKVRYYYSSMDSVIREYKTITDLLKKEMKDNYQTGIDTVYSDNPISSQFKAHGMTFKNKRKHYKIEVLKAILRDNYYGLYLVYEHREK